MRVEIDSWPEFVYRFVEHYFWEPQHLGPGVESFYAKIRRQEVPLNFLFNMLLYALPQSYRRALLAPSGIGKPSGPSLVVRNSRNRSFIQADVELDSESERIFVELKIRAKTGLDQLQKYVMLHALLAATDDSPRTPILIFVTKHPFARHWKSSEPNISSQGDVAPLLLKSDLSKKLRTNAELKTVAGSYEATCQKLSLGFLTWQDIGDQLTGFLRVDDELSDSLVEGFLSDLRRRGLWSS